MFNNFAKISAKGSASGSKKKEAWSLAEVCTAAVLFAHGASKKEIAEKIGRTEHSIGYKVFEDKTTNSVTGVVQCRGVRRYMYLEPTSPTNNTMLQFFNPEECEQIFLNIFNEFKQGSAFKSYAETVVPMATEFLTKRGLVQAKAVEVETDESTVG